MRGSPRLISGALDRFRNRSEAEFAGYTAGLDYLNQEDPEKLNVRLVLHLHRLLFSFTEGRGGSFKTDDNIVVDRQPDGTCVVRFVPVSARETPLFTDELVTRTWAALEGCPLLGSTSTRTIDAATRKAGQARVGLVRSLRERQEL
jgi:hypothetical protein